ncbi:hypothetical protein BH23CHL7_BH23CHL7_09360 [soil metagenome]
MADPQIRLQNIALEHAELMARRSMSWSESTNRTTMFMTVVGAAVVGLALFAQVAGAQGSVPILALLILSVVLAIGLTTFARFAQLDDEDMRKVQGLNRLRHMRLELDPELEPYLVTSRYDDFESVLDAYGARDRSFAGGLATLAVMLAVVNSVLIGVVSGLVVVNVGGDGAIAVVAGVIAAFAFVAATAMWFLRAINRTAGRFVTLVPAPPKTTAGPPAHSLVTSAADGASSADPTGAADSLAPRDRPAVAHDPPRRPTPSG